MKTRSLISLAALAVACMFPVAASAQDAPAASPAAAASSAPSPSTPSAPADSQTAAAPGRKEKSAKARVLVDGAYGKVDEVIELPASEIKRGVESGAIDDNKAAVEYAEQLAAKKKG